jgi:hypothetical protein
MKSGTRTEVEQFKLHSTIITNSDINHGRAAYDEV